MAERKLTAKQQRFVEEYLIDLNATQAAIRAGYSERTAEQGGAQLLRNIKVRAAIDDAQKVRAERTEITADRVLKELALIGFADMGDYLRITDDGNAFFDWSALPEGGTRVISEITQETYLEGKGEDAETVKKTKFKLYDKRAALVDIGRHLGMFKDRVELTGDPLSALYARVTGKTDALVEEDGDGASVH